MILKRAYLELKNNFSSYRNDQIRRYENQNSWSIMLNNDQLELITDYNNKFVGIINQVEETSLKKSLQGKLKELTLPDLSKRRNSLNSFDGTGYYVDHMVENFDIYAIIQSKLDEYFKNDTDDTPIEEVQEFQIEAIKINEGVVSDDLLAVLTSRLEEIRKCIKNEICLSGVIMIGSTLEGLLLGVAKKFSNNFSTASKAPKKAFEEWTLCDLINVANELEILRKDRKDLSHLLRQYRNYIHPDREMKEKHHPDKHTLDTSYAILKGVVHDLNVHAEINAQIPSVHEAQ